MLAAAPNATIDIFPDLISVATLSQDRLKKDWNKVRFGELGYRLLILFFPMLFAALFLYGYYALFPDLNPFAGEPDKPVEQHLSGSVQLIAPPAGVVIRPVAPAALSAPRSSPRTRN